MKKAVAVLCSVMAVLLVSGCAKVSVRFDSQQGPAVPSVETAKGKPVAAPMGIERDGYRFTGWHADRTGEIPWDFADPVQSDMTLYAGWTPVMHRFTCESNGGTVVPAQEVAHNTVAREPEDPIHEGHIFMGWFADAGLKDPWDWQTDRVTEDTTVYAGWQPAAYRVSYHAEGVDPEKVPPDSIHAYASAVTVADAPVRAGYRLIGWNTEPDGSGVSRAPATIFTMGDSPVDLYAQWRRPVLAVEAGSHHSFVLLEDGTLLGAGYNSNGQLGDGSRITRKEPVMVTKGVLAVSAGGGHTMVIDADGGLWGMGGNFEGQLGDGSLYSRTSPVKVMDRVARVSAGGSHTLVVDADGNLWSMGNNEDGQLGDGTTANRSRPVHVMANVSSVAAGEYHSLVLKHDGTLWTMGWNEHGQLGDGTTVSRSHPVQVLDRVISIVAGSTHSFAIREDGSLWAMGANGEGQLGDGTTLDRSVPVRVAGDARKVAAGDAHSLFIDSRGGLWGMGSNSYGQLGGAERTGSIVPVRISEHARSVSAGAKFSLVVDDEDIPAAFGINEYGQLGSWER